MSEPTTQDLKNLLLEMKGEIKGELSEVRNEIRSEISEVRNEIVQVRSEVTEVRSEINEVRSEIKRVEGIFHADHQRLEVSMTALEKTLTADNRRINESLNIKVDSFEKRLVNQEVISRTAFLAVIGGIFTGLAKLLFFPSNP